MIKKDGTLYLILKLLGSSWAIIHVGHSELVTINMYKDIKKKYPLSDYMIVRDLSGEIQQEIYSATNATIVAGTIAGNSFNRAKYSDSNIPKSN